MEERASNRICINDAKFSICINFNFGLLLIFIHKIERSINLVLIWSLSALGSQHSSLVHGSFTRSLDARERNGALRAHTLYIWGAPQLARMGWSECAERSRLQFICVFITNRNSHFIIIHITYALCAKFQFFFSVLCTRVRALVLVHQRRAALRHSPLLVYNLHAHKIRFEIYAMIVCG